MLDQVVVGLEVDFLDQLQVVELEQVVLDKDPQGYHLVGALGQPFPRQQQLELLDLALFQVDPVICLLLESR